jgi:threonylcarbamoyladenosine tRNA methylthiotransferase MtaB
MTAAGFCEAQPQESADVCIVNSCAVTLAAEKKCRTTLLRSAAQCRIAVLTGCYAALHSDLQRTMPPNVLVVPRKDELPNQISNYLSMPSVPQNSSGVSFYSAYSLQERTRSFLKVQDGCDYHCAYCTVPLARGESRSAAYDDIIAQAKLIAQAGIKEIVLTGINIGCYGHDTGDNLLHLLKSLQDINGIERFRLSSIEPNLLSNDIIDLFVCSPKLMPHFHIPLQAGSDRILTLMKRRYTSTFFAEKLRYVYSKIPTAFVGVDVIAGFPMETDEDFAEGYEFLQSLSVAYLHVFPYSMRPSTVAASLPQTPQHKIVHRARLLQSLCKRLQADFYAQQVGKLASVLFESECKDGRVSGFTGNYVRVEMPYSSEIAGKILDVKITEILPNGNAAGTLV